MDLFCIFILYRRVVFGVAFAGVSLGQSSAFLPDFAKAKHSASLLINLFNTEPQIDNYSTQGKRPVSLKSQFLLLH